MDAPSNSQQLFLRYVLDELSPDERSGIDDALIADQAFSDSFQEARYDLIDAYAANELPAEVRQRVEQAIFSTKDGQQALAASIAPRETRSATGDGILPLASAHKEEPPLRRRKFRVAILAFAAAACLVLVVVSIHLRQKTTFPEAQRSNTPAPEKSAAIQPTVPAAKSPPAIHPSSRRRSILAVAMPLGTTRGMAAVPIRLRPGIDRVEVQWPISADSAASLYTLEIASSKTGREVVPQHGPLATIGNVRVAKFLVPVDKLPNGESIFRLRAANVSGNMPIAESSVRVSR